MEASLATALRIGMGEERIPLARRERQVMDVVYRLRTATVAEIVDQMPDDVSYSAVRSALRILRTKGLVKHRYDGPRYVYRPTAPQERAARRALTHVVETFFGGAPEAAAATLLGMAELEIPQEVVDRLAERVEAATGEAGSRDRVEGGA